MRGVKYQEISLFDDVFLGGFLSYVLVKKESNFYISKMSFRDTPCIQDALRHPAHAAGWPLTVGSTQHSHQSQQCGYFQPIACDGILLARTRPYFGQPA